jgi:hypothetical protein
LIELSTKTKRGKILRVKEGEGFIGQDIYLLGKPTVGQLLPPPPGYQKYPCPPASSWSGDSERWRRDGGRQDHLTGWLAGGGGGGEERPCCSSSPLPVFYSNTRHPIQRVVRVRGFDYFSSRDFIRTLRDG